MEQVVALLQRLIFDIWYVGRPPWDSGISPPELIEFMASYAPGRAIDLGCGTGTNVVTLARNGWEVTGVDYSPRAIRMARRKVLHAKVKAKLSVCDVTRLAGVGGPFDLAFGLGCFHRLPSRSAYLAILEDILVQGGHWLMYGFLKDTTEASVPGVGPAELAAISSHGMHLISRQVGTDHGNRPSAWFLFERRES